jgi:hypothetical protein
VAEGLTTEQRQQQQALIAILREALAPIAGRKVTPALMREIMMKVEARATIIEQLLEHERTPEP